MLALLAATWKRLLLITLLAQLPLAVVFGAVVLTVHVRLLSPFLASPITSVFSDLAMAWIWAASLVVLQATAFGEQSTIWAAMRAALRDWRQILKLWAVFVVLALPYLAHAIYLAVSLDLSWSRLLGNPLAEVAGHYLSFAFVMLPVAVFIERRWLGRAFKLSHFSVRTAALIIAWIAIGLAVDRLLDLADLATDAGGVMLTLGIVVDIAFGIIDSVVIYAIFLRIRATEEAQEVADEAPSYA